MRVLAEKQCKNCHTMYIPTGSCSKFCVTCIPIMRKQQMELWRKQNKVSGKGSGSGTKSGIENFNYKSGIGICKTRRRETKEKLRYCQDCGKDLQTATHYQWVIHHIDHNRYNNPLDGSNWTLFCKKCHQKEHKCWLAFKGVTTREQSRSSQEGSEAHSTQTVSPVGNDIVCTSK